MNHVERITVIVRFKTSMLRSSLSDYSDASILFKGTIRLWTQDQLHHQIMLITK